ncbi:7992_t:CDS:2 [Funneliformis geosporum]|uniref:10430_t:CDS:1 n=1 Tax=Funneliformis geosporum TaxID=1117311 RepID=A0A9W4SIC2_9GLOM|nr:7992_t:CDS:2 [Funneliformis geosporum]CAI2169585.1 10430_t:CDS:2 [Funneliformis geosporum]
MSRVGTSIAIIAVSISLVILLLSYAGTKVDVDIPQDNSTHTGYPVWHPPFPGHYGQDQYATIFGSVILMAISGYFAYKWTMFDTKTNEELVTYLVDRAANKTTTIYFDQLLAAYSLVTGITGIAYLAFDIGKIWSTVGVFHNGLEVVILVALHQGGRIVSNKFLAWMILYFVSTLGFSIFLDWPYDTVWFKMQGLCQDFALAITFTRIYFATRNGYGDETHQRLFDVERPRENNGVKEYIFGSVSRFTPKHAKETSQTLPKFPILFINPLVYKILLIRLKVPTIATNNQGDFEAELAVKTCKNVDRENALRHVLGYTV